MKKETQKQTAYKAFDENFRCRDFQFEVGKEYSHEGKIKICGSGFHSCLNPIDTWSYYSVADSRFAEVEVWGKSETHDEDSKICSEHIKIVREISREDFIKLCADHNSKPKNKMTNLNLFCESLQKEHDAEVTVNESKNPDCRFIEFETLRSVTSMSIDDYCSSLGIKLKGFVITAINEFKLKVSLYVQI